MINCAGVAVAAKFVGSEGEPHDMDLWEWAFKVNVTGTFDLSRRVVQELIKLEPESGSEDGERGVIIMVASAAAVSIELSLEVVCCSSLLSRAV